MRILGLGDIAGADVRGLCRAQTWCAAIAPRCAFGEGWRWLCRNCGNTINVVSVDREIEASQPDRPDSNERNPVQETWDE